MKTALLIARVLLGLAFVVFALNFWLKFIPQPPPNAAGAAFFAALVPSGYFSVIKILELVGGLLLLSGRFAPLGLLVIGPILVNILLYDVFLDSGPLPIGIVLSALFLFVAWGHRAVFRPFFAPSPAA